VHRPAASQVLWILRQLAVVLLGVVVYFGVRGLTEGRPEQAVDHAHDVVALEHDLGIGWEHWFQSLLVGRDWLVDAANWVYIWGHWPVIAAVMLWLALRHRLVFLRLRNAMLLSGSVGLVIYASYPVAPPRLSGLGLVDTVTERSTAYRYLQPPAFVNQYAAMPSLHVGWDLLVGIAIISAASTVVLRIVGYLMPVLMATAVVLTANHYVIDGFAGSALALAGLAGAVWLERHYPPRAAGGAWHGPPQKPRRRTDEPLSRTTVA
jgi:hypothetical protein